MTDVLHELVLPKLDGYRRSGAGYTARCPAHDDRNPSLSVAAGTDQPVILHCQAGCDRDDILTALGLTWEQVCKPRDRPDRPTVIATYEYTDEHGQILFVKERRVPKDFRQKRPDGRGGWTWKLGDTRRVLYRLPQVLEAIRDGRTVYLVEGEKDVHAAERAGAVATCNFDGAAKSDQRPKWRPEYGDMLKGGLVVIVADNDEAGMAHARAAYADLDGKAMTVHIARGLVDAEHSDLSDHLTAGHTLDELVPIDEPVTTETPTAPEDEQGDDTAPEGRHLIAVPAAKMKMRAPRWLYEQRVPTTGITLLGGREGIGKSTIGIDIGARITRGELPGQYEGTPRSIAIVASEDDWSAVILPRLVAAGADLDRVYRIEARTEEGEYETVSVPADLTALAKVCEDRDIVMVIIDPIMSVIHGTLDTHKDREVRRALDPLNRFTFQTGVAAFGLIHVNKSSGTDPLNSIMASRAFTAVARSVLYCIVDPDAESEDRYLFGHPKSNLGPKQPTLAYRLMQCKLELADDDEVIVTSRVVWDGQDRRSIRDAMEPKRPERPAGELAARIVEWITEQGQAVSAGAVAHEFKSVNRATLDQNLSRMVKRGTLVRPFRGHYAVLNISDTSLETSEVSEVSDSSDRLTLLTDPTLPRTSEKVSERWPAGSHGDEQNPRNKDGEIGTCSVCHKPMTISTPGQTRHVVDCR